MMDSLVLIKFDVVSYIFMFTQSVEFKLFGETFL